MLRQCETAEEVREHYKAVRARTNQWSPPPRPIAEPEPAPEPVVRTIEIVDMSVATTIPVYEQEPEPIPQVRKHPSIHRIIGVVLQKYQGVSRADILSARRPNFIVRPRHIAMYLARHLTLRSLPEIGRQFGGRDHTSVLNAVRRIAALRASDPQVDAEISALSDMLYPPVGG